MTLLLMAAGSGSRYGKLKQFDDLGPAGEFLMEFSIFDALKNGEKWYSTNCPLPGHEDKKPSFNFNYSGGWTCFTCNKKGDAVHLAKELNLDPRPFYNYSLHKTGLTSLPRFDAKPILRVAHKKEY